MSPPLPLKKALLLAAAAASSRPLLGSAIAPPAVALSGAEAAEPVWKERPILVDRKALKEGTQEYEDRQVFEPGYNLEMEQGGDRLSVEVIPGKGGLLQAFSLNGKSIVLNKPWPDAMDGSVFWPSPQEAWDWPPPPEFDPVPSGGGPNSKYAAQASGPELRLTSPVSQRLGLQVTKRLRADQASGSLVMGYEIRNVGSRWISVAPWEITRVPPNGLSFFVHGKREPTSGTWTPLSLERDAGAIWFQQNSSRPSSQKLYADVGEGWLAQLLDDLLLVKCFRRIPDDAAAPDEAQVELYNGGDYVEVEVQGRYAALQPSEALEMKVHWHLKRVPAKAQRAQLVELARGLCQQPKGSGSKTEG